MRIAPMKGQEDAPTGLLPSLYTPEIGHAASEFSRITYIHSKLSLREFEAARMVTAHINGCRLCQNWQANTDLAPYLETIGGSDGQSIADNGPVPEDDFYRATSDWRASTLFSQRERLAMELAEGMGNAPKVIAEDEDFWTRAKAAFTDAEIVDLTYCISCWMALGRMTHVLGLDGMCSVPAAREAA